MVTATQHIELTAAQEEAVDQAIAFLKGDQRLFRIGGYAGTGKTTIAKEIVRRAREQDMDAAVCAFTGKACAVLRRKGLHHAKTIHSTIYTWSDLARKFVLEPVVVADYFLIDEGSMVSRALWDDLQTFGLPIIVIGDPGQLEPVGDDPRLMHDPDIVLEEIHRQAANSPIIEFANKVRRGADFRWGVKGEVSIVPPATFWQSLDWADHVLCGFNRTRVQANRQIRKLRGYSDRDVLVEGERIICLRNDRDLGVWNGQMLIVKEIVCDGSRGSIVVDAETEDGMPMPGLPIWTRQFNNELKLSWEQSRKIREVVIADYGYATTVHKYQGSEADNVLVMDEQCQAWEPERWRYTAITRAAKQLRYCIGR